MNQYVKINYINSNKEIMKLDDTEIMPDPLPRNIHTKKGLAAFRGSRIWVIYAKSFQSFFKIR